MARPPVLLSLSAVVSTLVLAACGGGSPASDDIAPMPADPPGSIAASDDVGRALDEDVVVSTNEPFWQARVEGTTLVLTGVDAPERRLEVVTSTMTADGRRVTARDVVGEVVLIVRRMRCEDDMSGARFPMTGLLTIDGRGPFRGCARPASMAMPGEPETATRVVPDVFIGRWDADQAACAAGRASDLALTIAPDRMVFHESTAMLTDVDPVDARTVRVSLDFEGEGERWQAIRTLRLDAEGGTLIVDAPDGAAPPRVRCED